MSWFEVVIVTRIIEWLSLVMVSSLRGHTFCDPVEAKLRTELNHFGVGVLTQTGDWDRGKRKWVLTE